MLFLTDEFHYVRIISHHRPRGEREAGEGGGACLSTLLLTSGIRLNRHLLRVTGVIMTKPA